MEGGMKAVPVGGGLTLTEKNFLREKMLNEMLAERNAMILKLLEQLQAKERELVGLRAQVREEIPAIKAPDSKEKPKKK